ncbi:major facilitator superfamily domain-containing protein [Fusarium tricinctum]|uniref:Major facilitator superfamily domain-containing protein n=1 Tax=Fusarium tricinctum TaxID=61284 RepID=A0A8K0S2J3_9HYPO|nr:major facilitator superfamily domain-containing protein [Fusarium tricinctum]
MPIETAVISQPRLAHTASCEFNDFNQPSASRSGSESQKQSKPVMPKVQVLAAGFSFFCAGVDGATLGPLLPYIIQSFSINAAEVAIIYACIFTGWVIAAVTNLFLTSKLSFSALLTLGATLQLLAQCLRPWATKPLFFVSFVVQAVGMGYQDTHANAWAGGLPQAHRCLGFIHAMFALGCVVGPLTATAIATATGSGHSKQKGIEAWRMGYFQLIGIHALNLIGMLLAFGNPLKQRKIREQIVPLARSTATADPEIVERRRSKEDLRDVGQLLRMKSFWLIGGFYLFNCGAWSAAGGWVVEYLVAHRNGALDKVGYVPTGFWAGLFLGRLLLAEPTHRFGEQRSIMCLSIICLMFHLLFWLVPNLVAGAVAFSFMGFFFGPFFATGMSVASRLFPRKIQSTALGLVFVLAQAGAAIFPSFTGLIATRVGVQVLQPVILGLIIGGAVCWWFIPKVPDCIDGSSD